MARIGKIARLSAGIRSQLNSRLLNGGEGKQIVGWLNSLPEVKQILADSFDGHPINEQNLTDWRQGGYEEWLAHQDILAQAAQLAADQHELAAAAPGKSLPDHLASAVSFRYAAILAAQGLEMDEKSLRQLKSLGRLCQAVSKLRRDEQNAARLKFESERWELEREELRAENEEAEKNRLRAALSARFMTAMKITEWYNKMGGGPLAAIAAGVLREIQMCQDPANFHSDILGNRTPEEMDRWVAEQVKKAPPRKTEIESAAEACRQMDAALGIGKDGEMTSRPRRRRKPHRRPRHRAAPRSNRVHKIHKVHRVHQVHAVHRAPPPADPPTPTEDVASSLRPDSAPPLEPPPCAPATEINPNQP